MLPQVLARRPYRKPRTVPAFRRVIERLENRLTPATATLSSGVLTIDYTATGTTAESVTIANDGANIVLLGDVTGSLSNPVLSVSKIMVSDSGASTNQNLTISGAFGISLSGGFSSTNVEIVGVNQAIATTSSGTISITGQTITSYGALTTAGGSVTLTASNCIALNNSLTTNGGAVKLSADSDAEGVGTLTISASVVGNWASQSGLTATGGAPGDRFGSAVALSIDGSTAIVGAYRDDVGGNTDQGSAIVFTRSGNLWTQQGQLTAIGGAASDEFGVSVAISADGNTAIVGAALDDVGGNGNQGTATLFTRSAGVWAPQQQLIATGGAANDQFGFSVSLSADGNTAIVGTPLDDEANPDQGSAVVFNRSGTVWSQQQKLTDFNGECGYSVALSADGNTALIGEAYDDLGGNVNRGSAAVFTRSGGTWSKQANLSGSGGADNDQFGWSVALSSDGNTAIVGAPFHDVGANGDPGRATVFTRSGTVWSEQAHFTDSGGAANDQFGYSVALSGDGNRAFVGVPLDNAPGTDQGSAVVFTRSGSVWSQLTRVTGSDGQFGIAVATSTDGVTAIAGTYLDDVGPSNDQGSAHVRVCKGRLNLGRKWKHFSSMRGRGYSGSDQHH